MILKAAIRRFLERPLDSHLWIKKVKRKDLWATVNSLHPRPRIRKNIFKHQLACFLLGLANPQFCFWLDMGTGKTRLTLELLKYRYECGELKRAIIFITSDKAFPTWEKQVRRFNIGLPATLLEGSSKEKWRTLEEVEEGLIFVSYPGAVAMCRSFKKKGRKKVSVVDQDKVSRLADGIGALVMDESTRASGRDSLTHRMIRRLGKCISVRYALAGRPFGRDPTLLFTQHLLIDGGKTLGDTLGMFRAAFMIDKPHPFAKNKYIKKWTFDKSKKKLLAKIIQNSSITYAAEECIDLPKHIPIREEVAFPIEAKDYYDQAVKTIIASKGNMSAVKNVFLRMRQLSSGFIGFKNDETGEKAQVEFDDNPKFDRLMELLEELPLDRKAVVFYDFTYSGRKIAAACKELGLKPIWLWAGTKNYKRDLDNFENDPRTRVAIVQNRVGAMSLDGLQVANYVFFFESPVGAIDREQAERRLRRAGQKRKVFQYDLLVRGSIDAKILEYHAEADGLMKALLRDPERIVHGAKRKEEQRRRSKPAWRPVKRHSDDRWNTGHSRPRRQVLRKRASG